MRKASMWIVLVVVAVLAVALVGCTTVTPPAATTPAPAATPAATYKLVVPGTLTIGSDTSFPPMESMNGAVAEGFDVDMMNAIGKEMGVKVVFKTEGFDTLIPTLKAGGKFDAIVSAMTINSDRQKEIDFSDPYFDSNQSIAMKVGAKFTSEADLKGKKIGVQSGTTGQAWTKEHLKDSTAVPFKTATEAFAALQAGNVDAVVNDLPVTAEIVKDKARGMRIVKGVGTAEQYGIGVSKDNPELLKAINAALAKIKGDGTLKAIYDKWIPALGK